MLLHCRYRHRRAIDGQQAFRVFGTHFVDVAVFPQVTHADNRAGFRVHHHRLVYESLRNSQVSLRVENQAGKRVQMSLNETDPIEWTEEARSHYQLEVGGAGDGRYVQGWHGPERLGRPFRWSRPGSRFLLPVVPGN